MKEPLCVILVLAVSVVLLATSPPALAGATRPEPVGGNWLLCVASGLLFGAAILSGNVLTAAGAVVTAYGNGCL